MPVAALGAGDVRVAVELAGICRTDLHVASGAIGIAGSRILGHELTGRVVEVGAAAAIDRGQRVAVDPALPCGRCPDCLTGRRCPAPRFLGLDVDGGFAETAVIPAAALVPVPARLEGRRAAFVEPLAAALAVLEAGLDPDRDGAIFGAGRIAELTARVLAAAGFPAPARIESLADLGGARFDWIIETDLGRGALDPLIAAVAAGGVVVLKSRPAGPVALDVRAAVARQVQLRAVAYGSFSAAVDWLAGDRLELADLFGASFALEDFERAFAAAANEGRKCFFAIGEVA
jgi:threonine dehydrogenase-like Zn-dependent dehydrogenase